MTRKPGLLALLCLVPALAPAPLAAQSFEGTVTMNITSDNGTARSMSFMLKGGKMRFDPGGSQVSVIIDPTAQRMTVIMNAQKMYMQRDFSGAVPAMQQMNGGKGPAIVKTGKFETVAGYKCEHMTLTDTDGRSVDACMSSEFGGFRMPAASNPMAPQEEAGWLTELGDHNFPLKVTKDGKTVMEVTGIEKKQLDASLFAPPEGYQSFAMPVRKRPVNY
ncbi:MAG: DUF4412 domain-containing protein [Gemmatimonadaceae bacterium]